MAVDSPRKTRVSRTVILLHNVTERANLSMRLYAERVAAAVGAQWEVRHVGVRLAPDAEDRPSGKRLAVLAKSREYLSRYVIYPLKVAGLRGDVFHIVDHAYGHLMATLPRRRCVVSCHDLILFKLAQGEFGPVMPVPKTALLLLRLSAAFLRCAARVVVDSRATARDVHEYLRVPRGRVEVVYPGVDECFGLPPSSSARDAARRRFDLDGRPTWLHVGNNWFYKNIESVLHALALSNENSGQLPVLLKVGQRFSDSQRVLIQRLGIEDRVRESGLLDA